MRKASVMLDRDFAIGQTDPRLFGAFIEHLGRCVYGGIYEPGHPTADEQGFRNDVLALVKELGPTIMRYPGGNFVSGYNWEDGVGPVEQRPRSSTSPGSPPSRTPSAPTNSSTGAAPPNLEPMMAVNLGTRGGDAARNLLEYCNHPGGTHWSDLRRAARLGEAARHQVLVPGQRDGWPLADGIQDRHRLRPVAKEAAKMMRWIDPSIELAACGSSGRNMPTFGRWEDEVLDHTFDHAEFISLHTYLNNYTANTGGFLASPDLMDMFIEEVVAIADGVAASRRSTKRIMLSFDEWNVWYRTRRKPRRPGQGGLAGRPADTGGNLHHGGRAGLRRRLHLAAQPCRPGEERPASRSSSTSIAPIMTETGGPAWRQTIFWPFAHMSRLGRGRVLRTQVELDTYDSSYYDPRGAQELTFPVPNVPYLKVAAVAEEAGSLSLFMLNRDLKQDMEVNLEARSFGRLALGQALELRHDDLQATNTKDATERVKPAPLQGVTVDAGRLQATLKPASWNVIHVTAN